MNPKLGTEQWGYCDHCQQWDRITYDNDPYLYDVEGIEEPSWWCESCMELSCDEI